MMADLKWILGAVILIGTMQDCHFETVNHEFISWQVSQPLN
jgi:hypothetical protein